MEVDYYKPKSEILKKYLEGYYFLKASSEQETIKYFTFPNNYCILSVSFSSVNVFSENKITKLYTKREDISGSLVTRYIKPIEIVLETPINEVVFYFKPLGINRFLEDFLKLQNKSLSCITLFEGLESVMRNVLLSSDRQLQIEMIEDFWQAKLIEKDYSLLESVLVDLNSGYSINEISAKHYISRQHLLRVFSKNIGKSMVEYRKIERFRNSLNINIKKSNLTEIAFENNFFDQSHLINNFKEITNMKPSKFFEEVDVRKPTIWNFR